MHFLNPRVGLRLGINIERPSVAFCNAYAILSGELIDWKSISLPFLNSGLRAKEVTEFILLVVREFKLTNLLEPNHAQLFTVVGGERTAQTHERGGESGVTDQVIVLDV